MRNETPDHRVSRSIDSTGLADVNDPTSRSERDPWLDNLKLTAIALVVLGHGLTLNMAHDGLALAAANFVYFFHMPMFAMISGWFASRSTPSFDEMQRSAAQLLLPYLAFQFVYVAMYQFSDQDYDLRLVVPGFGLWYLLSLFSWRLVAPWFSESRLALPTAIAIAVLAGYTSRIGTAFSFSRTLVFLPAFLLGALYADRLEVALRRRDVRRWGAVAVAAAAVIAVLTRHSLDRAWILGNLAYTASGSTQWWAGAWRVATILTGLLLAVAVASLVPRKRSWLTAFGRYTLYAYLLHLPLRQSIRAFELLPIDVGPRTLTLGIVVISLLCTLLLMSWPVRFLTQPVVEPWRYFRRFRSSRT